MEDTVNMTDSEVTAAINAQKAHGPEEWRVGGAVARVEEGAAGGAR